VGVVESSQRGITSELQQQTNKQTNKQTQQTNKVEISDS
jgi:hypothetical protein